MIESRPGTEISSARVAPNSPSMRTPGCWWVSGPTHTARSGRRAGGLAQVRAFNRLYHLSAKIVQSVKGRNLYLTKHEFP